MTGAGPGDRRQFDRRAATLSAWLRGPGDPGAGLAVQVLNASLGGFLVDGRIPDERVGEIRLEGTSVWLAVSVVEHGPSHLRLRIEADDRTLAGVAAESDLLGSLLLAAARRF